MEYSKFLEELYALRDESFVEFQRRIIKSKAQKIIGVRTPAMRTLVKKYKGRYAEFSRFPDEYYEVTFIKLNLAATLPYEEFVVAVEDCVNSIENWAACDTFKPKCVALHKNEFIPYLNKFLSGGEFAQRFALVTLLNFYVEKDFLTLIFDSLSVSDTLPYYTYMGAAWLLSEVLVKYYAEGAAYLKENKLDVRTHNKAIQKARESYRLSPEQKKYLASLRRKSVKEK